MTKGSLLGLPKDIKIESANQCNTISISLCLYRDVSGEISGPNISGFPRQPFTHNGFPLFGLDKYTDIPENLDSEGEDSNPPLYESLT